MKILGVVHSGFDPSAALLIDDQVTAYVEEERLIRNKHAAGWFPTRSIEYVLQASGVDIADIDYIVQAWDCKKYDDGVIAKHYEELNKKYPTNSGDIAYQNSHLNTFRSERQRGIILQNLRRQYGEISLPDIKFVHHHFSHACTAYFCSGIGEALVLTLDGSGEEITTAWWIGKDDKLTLLNEIKVPHSLGWLYSAFTEYLGFRAYDGEYKVMGLAAFGENNEEIKSKIDKLIRYDGEGGFDSDPLILARGPRQFSHYYPDALPEYLGRPPRAENQPIEKWHKDCAFVVQQKLEEIVQKMAQYWIEKTGVRNLCISGGVGLNVKMNGNIFASGLVDDLFIFPLCSDAGQSIGAAMALRYELCGLKNAPIDHLYFGPEFADEEIKGILSNCKIEFSEEKSIEKKIAKLISEGAIVGWFQGRMEGGPRALGARSILGDPRDVNSRDRVNEVIKYRELWRPFCPSMTAEGAERYFDEYTNAPFMIMTFRANKRAEKEIPAVVHVDNTSRPHIVSRNVNERYYNLIQEFEKLTGIPVLLNTSFNVKGEPIVCTPQDALRTYSATGLDALAIGNCLVTKSNL